MSFTRLAEDILAKAKLLDAHIASQNRQEASFDDDSLTDVPPDIEAVRTDLVDSTHTLKHLALGPTGTTMDIIFSWADLLSLRAIYTYSIPSLVPLFPADASISYTSLASQTPLSEELLRRFLHHAMGSHIFAETPTPKGPQVRHTAISRLLATDPDLMHAVGLEACELAPAADSVVDALAKWGESGEQHECGYSLEHNTQGKGIYAFLGTHPERAKRFGAGMKYFTKSEDWDLKHLVSGFDWAALDTKPGAVVVDVGGGHGSVSQYLARATKNLHFVVQDLPGTAKQGRELLPEELRGRIEFVEHDFFSEQDLNADVYLLRWILHNWSDRHCVRILRALVPAMRKGVKVVVYEWVLKEEPETRVSQRMGPNLDMVMQACFNGAERPESHLRRIFKEADKRFVISGVVQPPGSTMSVIEVDWRP